MSKPIIAVVVCTLLALVATTLFVPVRAMWRYPRAPESEIAELRATMETTGPTLTGSARRHYEFEMEVRLAALEGSWHYDAVFNRWSKPRYEWIWEAWIPDPVQVQGYPAHPSEEWRQGIHWPYWLATQALILLLGGGLLTFVVRRERRARAWDELGVEA